MQTLYWGSSLVVMNVPRCALSDAHFRQALLNVQQHRVEQMALALETRHYSTPIV